MNATKVEYSQRKLIMWYKINELFSKGLRQAQICRETGLDKKTVRRYHNMTYEEFVSSPSYHRQYIKFLDSYESTVKGWLEAHCDLSSSQVHDWLRERYSDFPK